MTYRDVLHHRPFLAMLLAHLVTLIGGSVASLALAVLLFERTHSPLLSTLTFTLTFTPYLLSAQLAPRLERLPARTLMSTCSVVQGGCYLAMAAPGLPVVLVLALLSIGGLAGALEGATRAAMLPEILGAGEGYVLGRSLLRLVSQSSQILGLAVGSGVLLLVSADSAIAGVALCCLVAAAVLRIGLPRLPGIVVPRRPGAHGRVLGTPTRRNLVLLSWLVPLVSVASEALAVPYVVSIGLPAGRAGLLLWAAPLGVIVGELLAVRLLSPALRDRSVVPLAVVVVAVPIGFALHPGAVVAALLLGISTAGFGYTLGMDGRMMAATPEHLRRRTLSVTQSGSMVVQGIGFAMAGAFAQVVPVQLVAPGTSVVGLVLLAALCRGEGSLLQHRYEPAGADLARDVDVDTEAAGDELAAAGAGA